MNGKIHVAIGVGCTIVLSAKYPTGFDLWGFHIVPTIGLATAAVGGYMPDIDQLRSHMGMKHEVASKVINKVGGGHRGITHTLLFPAIVAALMYVCNMYLRPYPYLRTVINSLLFGFNFSYVLHIFADLFNGKGCPILWPLMKGKLHIADLPSTGFVPYLFTFVFIAAFTLMFGGLF